MNNITDVKEQFKKRFSELRYETGLSQLKLGKLLKLSPATIGYYENGDRVPDIVTAARIANYFYVSVDYLLGLSDVRSTDQDMKTACEVTGLSQKAVENIAEIANMYDTTLIKQCGLKANPVAEPTYEEKTRVIKRFFESKELKEIAMAIQEAVIYQQGHKIDQKKSASLVNKLSHAVYSRSKDEFKDDELQLNDIYQHKYDRIARTYLFDAYEKISGFVNNISEEQEAGLNGEMEQEAQE